MQDQLNKAKELAAEYSKDVAQKLQERANDVSSTTILSST
jgi:hypothetical protein